MRIHKKLFLPEPGKSEGLATVSCAMENFDAIKPLATRLEFPPGVVGMIHRPAIMKAKLNRITALRLVKGFAFDILIPRRTSFPDHLNPFKGLALFLGNLSSCTFGPADLYLSPPLGSKNSISRWTCPCPPGKISNYRPSSAKVFWYSSSASFRGSRYVGAQSLGL